jgi:putative copper export protein
VYTALVLFHLLAAAVWIGGTVALVFTAVPVLRLLPQEQRADSVRQLGRRWKPIGWGSLAVLAASGIWLAFGYWGLDDPDTLSTRDGRLLVAKAVIFLTLVTTAALHDFVLGPRLNRQIRSGAPQTLRRPMQIAGWWTFAATVTLPILGVLVAT